MNGQYNVLFLCTGNSARSIIAEAVANQLGKDRLRAYSAGSTPVGHVHPMAIQLLESAGLPTRDLASKHWDAFSGPEAPRMDFIITLCDRAAQEACPVWPGRPITAHWSVPDPAVETGSPAQVRQAFHLVMQMLQQRISLMLALPMAALDRMSIEARLTEISRAPVASPR